MTKNTDKTGHSKTTTKFYQQVGEECSKTYQQLDAKKAKQFWSKILECRDHNRETKWISIIKMLQRLEERQKQKYISIHSEQHKKEIPNWKTPDYDGIHRFWFKNSPPSITDWLSK